MRVVIDTNVFVSSFFGGNPRKIIELWKNGRIVLCLSRPILDEYIAVLQRMGLDDENQLKELLTLLGKGYNLVFTTKTPVVKVVETDPDDDKFIECALALKASVIVTGDKALERIAEYRSIKILTPRQFLAQIETNTENQE